MANKGPLVRVNVSGNLFKVSPAELPRYLGEHPGSFVVPTPERGDVPSQFVERDVVDALTLPVTDVTTAPTDSPESPTEPPKGDGKPARK